ncbi:MAG: ABC transporter permease subunit, partial [Bdellovibrionales bacterium]|nr:ABC transporter permease subunit [Bdellovibrionales bacterium]
IILLFGVRELSAYSIVFIGAFPPVFFSTYVAAANVPKAITRFADSLELSPFERQFKITMMCMAPIIFTSAKVAAGMAWMCVIAAEMISGQSGLGYAIQLSRLNMQFQEIVIYMIAIGTIGYLIHWALNKLEKTLLPWSLRVERQDV